MKKYSVVYNSAPNSCGIQHRENFDTIKEVEREVGEYLTDYYSSVSVFDNELDDYIFYKECMSKPDINLIKPSTHFRDLRTTTRKANYQF